MKKKIKLLFILLLIFAILIVCYSRYIEPERLVLKEITVETNMNIETCRIEAKDGKYAVFGNHDYGGGAIRIYEDFINNCGFQVLDDETVFHEKFNIEIIGFDDYLLGQTETDFYHFQSDKFHLIATHEPVISKYIEGSGENFILSGHTHGGQVSLPYFTKKLLPNDSDQFIKGFYDMQAIGTDTYAQMYVSSGIGLTKYPFRFFNVPEIIEVNLVRKE